MLIFLLLIFVVSCGDDGDTESTVDSSTTSEQTQQDTETQSDTSINTQTEEESSTLIEGEAGNPELGPDYTPTYPSDYTGK